jgi:hypothetical protein
MLSWAAGLGAVTAESAVDCGIAASLASARGRLAAAVRDGSMRRSAPLRDAPALYTVTRKGLRAAGEAGLKPSRVSAASARHAVACCEVAAALAAVYPDRLVLGEPAVRRLERQLGRSLSGHRPDLLLVDRRAPKLVAVEVELTVKAPERLLAICRGWARSRAVAGTIYVAAEPVLAPLTRAIESLGAEDRIALLPISELPQTWRGSGGSACECEPSQAIRSVECVGGSSAQGPTRNGEAPCTTSTA